jgi:hypothetical protein
MNKIYFGIIVVLACSLSSFGQTSRTKQPPVANQNGGKQMSLMSGTSLDAQLQHTVDVNSAKVGDEVILKTTRPIKQNGDVAIAKGTTLIGRITEVQRWTKDNSQSRLSLIFDRIEGKDLSVPISASIVSITNVAAQAAAGDALMSDISGSSQTSGRASSGGSGGGGLLGGVGNTVGGLVNTTTETAGTVTSTVGQTAGTATGTVGRTVSGLQISSSASGSANSSTTLSSNRNVRIEKGATFNLRVHGQKSGQE